MKNMDKERRGNGNGAHAEEKSCLFSKDIIVTNSHTLFNSPL